MCEHHMLPFFGKAHVAYIPSGKIVGLSKIPRLVDVFARRLQVQERLTIQIRDCLQDVLNPAGRGRGDRGPAHVHDDARRGEAELQHHHERHERRLPRQHPHAGGIHAPHRSMSARPDDRGPDGHAPDGDAGGDPQDDGLTFRMLLRDELPLALPLLAALNPGVSPHLLEERLLAAADYPTYRCAAALLDPALLDPGLLDAAPLGVGENAGVSVLDGQAMVALAGLWETNRPYSGKQLEPDHVVVLPAVRSRGVGRKLMAWIEALARAEGCETIELNAYLANTRAHAFYAADGFAPLGYHFQKTL